MVYYNKLKPDNDNFAEMMNGFGVVTVMNADVYEIPADYGFSSKTAETILNEFVGGNYTKLATIDSLKIANITVEGPNKTVTGGRYSNPLIKFGKSARLEMQDALGRADAIEAFGGSVNEYTDTKYTQVAAMHITEDFAPTRLIIGDSFFISNKSGQQVKVKIIFYQVLPDSIFNLNQDAEGDATVFDMNADLLTTEIKMNDAKGTVHGVFYSIVPYEAKGVKYYTFDEESGLIKIADGYKAKVDGADFGTNNNNTVAVGSAVKLVISTDKGENSEEVLTVVLER